MPRERKRFTSTTEKTLEIEVIDEVAFDFAKLVRELKEPTTRQLARSPAFPPAETAIEFGREYKKRRTLGSIQYFLQYPTVVKALKLAEQQNAQLALIDTTVAQEKEVAIWAFKEQPSDNYTFIRFWSLTLFLEKLQKDERLEVTTTQRLAELYLALRAHLPV